MRSPATQKCQVCGSSMEEGFVLDRGMHGNRSQEVWSAGKPQRSFWTGLNKPERTCKVTTLHCTKCRNLMEFAMHDEGRTE